MADLYSQVIVGDGVSTYTVGGNTRKVLTTSDVTGPETTWIVVDSSVTFETGTDYEPELTTANSVNQQVIDAIAQWCEIYEVVRPGSSTMAIKVRANSVPYAAGEARDDADTNTILQTAVRAATGSGSVDVWNGGFQDDRINYD